MDILKIQPIYILRLDTNIQTTRPLTFYQEVRGAK